MAKNIDAPEGFGEMGEAPENKEREYLKPGFHKLTVTEFEYKQEEEGKTPLIVMKCLKANPDGDPIQFEEKLYISGKLNKQNVMSSVVRLQELFKGLTGEPKMKLNPSKYNYTKKESDNSETTFTIPNPKELAEYLSKTCVGKIAIFKIGGEETAEGTIYSKFTYSGFLYYTDKKGNLVRYTEERDFTDAEYKFAVQKKKEAAAPAHSNGVANATKMQEL
jgi:hypothetical protein